MAIFSKSLERNVALAPLDGADVSTVQFTLRGKCFLRQPGRQAKPAQVTPKTRIETGIAHVGTVKQ